MGEEGTGLGGGRMGGGVWRVEEPSRKTEKERCKVKSTKWKFLPES